MSYLSPEPLLQEPSYVTTMAQSGLSVPTYAYALNNPLRYVDPDGRDAAAAAVQAGSRGLTGVASTLLSGLGSALGVLGGLWPSPLGNGTFPYTPGPAPSPSPSPSPTPSPGPQCIGGNGGGDPCDTKLTIWHLKQAGVYGKEHDVKKDWLGKKAPISRYDLCGCLDGRVVIKARGCKGGIISETEYAWK